MARLIVLSIMAVLVFGILAVEVKADDIIGDLGGAVKKVTTDFQLGSTIQESNNYKTKGIDNIDYTLNCEDQCTLTLNKEGYFQNRIITYDTTYQVLIKNETNIPAVMDNETGEIIKEAIHEPAVYETRNYTTQELNDIAQEKINSELGALYGDMTRSAQAGKAKKLEQVGKVK